MMIFPESVAAEKAKAIAKYLDGSGAHKDPAAEFAVEFDESSPSSVAANLKNPGSAFYTPAGEMMCYLDIENGNFQITFKLLAYSEAGDAQLKKIGDYFQFGEGSELAKKFFSKAVGDKTNKIFERMNKKKLSPEDRRKHARQDSLSDGRTSFTKKVIDRDADQLDEANPDACPVTISLKANYATKEGQTGWAPQPGSELENCVLPISGFFEAGGQLKACPFKTADNARLGWEDVLPLFTTSKSGSMYFKATSGRFNITGAVHRWTAENPATKSNYNRILTLLFGASSVILYAVTERNGVAIEDEAPDEDLLAAFNSAGAE